MLPHAEGMTRILQARPRRTVLVVEDALTTRCILEQFFARAGCDVLHASDPETALLRLRSTTIDAVILDLRLAEDRSGLEVLEQMRLDERYDDVPVVVLTGVTEVNDTEEEVIQRHGAHLLYKRFGYREVVQRLEKILTAEAA
jgi:DNA-binding response OmpR family regulator